MKIIRFTNPFAFIARDNFFKQYYIKGKMLQIDKKGKTLINTDKMKIIRRIFKNGK